MAVAQRRFTRTGICDSVKTSGFRVLASFTLAFALLLTNAGTSRAAGDEESTMPESIVPGDEQLIVNEGGPPYPGWRRPGPCSTIGPGSSTFAPT